MTANDPNAGHTLSWQIISGNTVDAFQIHSATGQISVASPVAVDFETTPIFQLTVRVTDSDAEDPLSDTAVMTMSLNDILESPPASVYRIGDHLVVHGSQGNDRIYL